MSIGYETILRIRQVEEQANDLGFRFANAKTYSQTYGDRICLMPATDISLPIYTRDAEIFTGTLDDVRTFLRGIEWAREYDRMIKVSNHKVRIKKEQDVRNDSLLRALKAEAKKVAKVD